MSKLDVIRAWKDEAYRMSLSEEERTMLPAHPAGVIELIDAEIGQAVGGAPTRCGPDTFTPGTTVPPDPVPSTRLCPTALCTGGCTRTFTIGCWPILDGGDNV